MGFDVDAVRARYPALGDGRAWLDGAAGTQVPDVVVEAVARAYQDGLGNQGAVFATSDRLAALVATARAALARLVNAPDPEAVVFGPSMTALSYRFASALGRRWGPGDEVVVTELDHDANLWPWVQAAERAGARVRTAPLDRRTGCLPTERVTGLLSERTRLVAVTAASNLLGTMPDIPAITAAARACGAVSFVDGVHHCPHAVVDVAALGADVYVTSVYKWYGPHLAAAVARPGLLDELPVDHLRPVPGGGAARFEQGTHPFPTLAGVIAAVAHLADPVRAEPMQPYEGGGAGPAGAAGVPDRAALVAARGAAVAHEQRLARMLVTGLGALDGVRPLPGWDATHRAPTVTFRVRGATPVAVATALDRAGVNVWHGYAYCWAAAEALGVREAGGGVRASLNHYNTDGDVHRLLEAVSDCASTGR